MIAQLGASAKAMWGMQQFITDSTWDADAILRRRWQEVAVDLDDVEGMLIAAGSDFPKLAYLLPSDDVRRRRGERILVRMITYSITNPNLPGYKGASGTSLRLPCINLNFKL